MDNFRVSLEQKQIEMPDLFQVEKRKYKTKDYIRIAQEYAQEHGGRCLSTAIRRSIDDIDWECKHGHKFNGSYTSLIRLGKWCPKCVKSAYYIRRARKYAKTHNGKCIIIPDGDYSHHDCYMEWECQYGHRWKSKMHDAIKNNHWCAECAKNTMNHGKTEQYCRLVFEALFEKPFPTVRPDWLKNPDTGVNLEIDGYNDELKLGFEYQGVQHYRQVKRFTPIDLQQERDKIKRTLTAEHGVTIIEIPYYKKLNTEKIISDIKFLLQFNGYDFTNKDINIDISQMYNNIHTELEQKVLERQSIIVEGQAYTHTAEVSVKCENGHIFTTSLSRIDRGRWCPYCSGAYKNTAEDVALFCAEHNITPMFDKYIPGQKQEYKLSCGHTWSTTFANMKKREANCPECWRIANDKAIAERKAKREAERDKHRKQHLPFTIESINKWAKDIGLECIEPEYLGKSKSMHWLCYNCGRTFTTSLAHLKYDKQRCRCTSARA